MEIEIIQSKNRRLKVAFYYKVPAGMQTPDAVDRNRFPRGVQGREDDRLVEDLQMGMVTEHVCNIVLNHPKIDSLIKNTLHKEYSARRLEALDAFNDKYNPEEPMGYYRVNGVWVDGT